MALNFKLIIENCRKGDRNSQRVLYEHYYGYAMQICLRYTSNKEEAMEVLNDGYLKIFQKIDRYDPDLPFKNWIRRIFTNAAIDHFRKNQKRPRFTDLEEVGEPVDESVGFVEVSSEVDILPILQKLSPRYRIVFNLYVMEEYKHHEIAELLGISVGTSKSNLLRAKHKLVSLLSREDKLVNQSS